MARVLAGVMTIVTLFLVLCCGLASAKQPSGRISEKAIDLSFANPSALRDVPIVDPPTRVAGYFKLNRTHDAHMFYFFYESRAKRQEDPVVLWMTGGPGCSSEIAIFYENGPYTLSHNMTLRDNPYGWDVNANVIFVDQPIGTGFSWTDDPRDIVNNEKLVADDMLDFLQEFFEVHPNLANRDFFVTGESYAGHYAPAVAHRVYVAKELGEGPPVNLKGVAIGNGLTKPDVQFGAYADYALQEGVISQGTRNSIQWFMPLCGWGARMCSRTKWSWVCALTLEYCQLAIFSRVLAAKPGINVYDIRKQCVGPLCYDFSDADAFLNSATVRRQLGVGEHGWSECDMTVHAAFMGDFMRDFSHKLVPLLEDDVNVLIYAGDKDLICNYLGNRRWVDGLQWSGTEGWQAAQDEDWMLSDGGSDAGRNGAAAGRVKNYKTLTFLRVFDAGHMVPMDQPAAALDMITRFTRNASLAGSGPTSPLAVPAAAAAGTAPAAAKPQAERVVEEEAPSRATHEAGVFAAAAEEAQRRGQAALEEDGLVVSEHQGEQEVEGRPRPS